MKLRFIAWCLMIAAVLFTWKYHYFLPPSPDAMTDLDDAGDLVPEAGNFSKLPPYAAPPNPLEWGPLSAQNRVDSIKERVLPLLAEELNHEGFELGAPVYLRVFKESRELELWLKHKEKGWQLFRTYYVAAMSGRLGPKLKEGDLQAPEGFYNVTRSSLNPKSSYHLSFNIGYPNAFDRHHKRTGGLIMVHGKQASIGCFAMTDRVIEEMYLLVESALLANQKEVPVHVFPFRMTDFRMLDANESPWYDFWEDLRDGYDLFEQTGQLPKVSVRNGRYHCTEAPES